MHLDLISPAISGEEENYKGTALVIIIFLLFPVSLVQIFSSTLHSQIYLKICVLHLRWETKFNTHIISSPSRKILVHKLHIIS